MFLLVNVQALPTRRNHRKYSRYELGNAAVPAGNDLWKRVKKAEQYELKNGKPEHKESFLEELKDKDRE